jgi:hypothetical protein
MTGSNFGTFRNQMRREMSSADEMYARANTLRSQGRTAEANALELRAERIDNRHTRTTYSTWLDARA